MGTLGQCFFTPRQLTQKLTVALLKIKALGLLHGRRDCAVRGSLDAHAPKSGLQILGELDFGDVQIIDFTRGVQKHRLTQPQLGQSVCAHAVLERFF